MENSFSREITMFNEVLYVYKPIITADEMIISKFLRAENHFLNLSLYTRTTMFTTPDIYTCNWEKYSIRSTYFSLFKY